MKPCYKKTPSDCVARCVESLVGHLTGPVPNFIAGSPTSDSDAWMAARINRWLKRHDLGLVFVNLENDRKRIFSMPVPTYCILFCEKKGKDRWGHAVVGKISGRRITVAHDPDYYECGVNGAIKLSLFNIDAIGFIVHGDTVARGPVPKPGPTRPE